MVACSLLTARQMMWTSLPRSTRALVEIIRVRDLQPQVRGICGDDADHERLGGISAANQQQLFVGFRGVVEISEDFLLCRKQFTTEIFR